jgi:uncharacterized protein (DUF983 family)
MKKNAPPRGHLLKSILLEKCPNCGKGSVFEQKKLFRMPVMKERCDVCGYKFDREPGYFLGAMYVSYGLAVLEAIVTFLIMNYFWPDLPLIWFPVAITVVVLLFSFKNYKLSRIIYIHIFPW